MRSLPCWPYPKCVASTSAPDRLMLSLEVTGLSPLFGDNVFSAVEVANGKPAPDLFLLAAQRLGVEAASCIVIEDSVLGVKAARAAGMAVIGFAGGSHANQDLGRASRRRGGRTGNPFDGQTFGGGRAMGQAAG